MYIHAYMCVCVCKPEANLRNISIATSTSSVLIHFLSLVFVQNWSINIDGLVNKKGFSCLPTQCWDFKGLTLCFAYFNWVYVIQLSILACLASVLPTEPFSKNPQLLSSRQHCMKKKYFRKNSSSSSLFLNKEW